jgi:hypothetical protein
MALRDNGGVWNSALDGTQDPVLGDMYTSTFASTDWVDAAPGEYSQLAA